MINPGVRIHRNSWCAEPVAVEESGALADATLLGDFARVDIPIVGRHGMVMPEDDPSGDTSWLGYRHSRSPGAATELVVYARA